MTCANKAIIQELLGKNSNSISDVWTVGVWDGTWCRGFSMETVLCIMSKRIPYVLCGQQAAISWFLIGISGKILLRKWRTKKSARCDCLVLHCWIFMVKNWNVRIQQGYTRFPEFSLLEYASLLMHLNMSKWLRFKFVSLKCFMLLS